LIAYLLRLFYTNYAKNHRHNSFENKNVLLKCCFLKGLTLYYKQHFRKTLGDKIYQIILFFRFWQWSASP